MFDIHMVDSDSPIDVAQADPLQDVWEYSGGLSYRPNYFFGSQSNYAYQKYTQSGVVYENLYKKLKARLSPENLPSLEYVYLETHESNDPVSGSLIQRIITRNSAEMRHRLGFVSTHLKGTLEEWLQRSPSQEVIDYQKLNFGLASVGLEKIAFTTNIEIENRQEPDGQQPYRKTYYLNLSFVPNPKYFFSSAFQIIDDTKLGQTNVADLAYRVQPTKNFKTNGKYRITSVLEDFSTTSEAVSKQSGSFSFDLRPSKHLRLRYLFKPNFTQIVRTNSLSYFNDLRQAEINIIPHKQILLGVINKQASRFNIYKNDYPNYSVKEESKDSVSNLYTLKMAPYRILSTEFNYRREKSFTNTLAATQEPYAYLKGRAATESFDAVLKTSLSEKFSIDARYTYQKSDQGSSEALSNLLNTKTHTGSLKGIWRTSDAWTFSMQGAFSRTTDYILSQVTYTVSPGFGFIYRLGDVLRVDFDYNYSKSYQGAESQVHALALKSKYAVSEFVDFTIQLEHEIGRAPDYRLTDILGNLEIEL